MTKRILDLNFDGNSLFDSSKSGARIKTSIPIKASAEGEGFAISEPTKIEIKADESAGELENFTVELNASASKIGAEQTILENLNPPVRIRIDAQGRVVGEVRTSQGWEGASSSEAIKSKEDTRIRLLRNGSGKVSLELNNKEVASADIRAELKRSGKSGLQLGSDSSGASAFKGTLSGIAIHDGALSAKELNARDTHISRVGRNIFDALNVPGRVIIQPGEIDHRFAQIKSIMQGAGISNLSDLATLSITRRTRLNPGTIMIAPEKQRLKLDWSDVATEFVRTLSNSTAEAKTVLDKTLLSKTVKINTVMASEGTDTNSSTGSVFRPRVGVPILNRPTLDARSRELGSRVLSTNIPRTNLGVRLSRNIAPTMVAKPVHNVVALKAIEAAEPGDWPIMSAPLFHMVTSNVVPVNAAVIIARRLDLTNQTLEIDPAVGTLYIIAEEIEASSGAAITWKRSPVSAPNIGRDPGLDGLDRHGVDLAPKSKHGLPGGDAREGASGLEGLPGDTAPNVEIWALRFNGMPDIDLEGQDGGQGGRGQQGGEGGRGAQGRAGKWYWNFGKRCWSGPGDGGDGGDGADGGRGGRGGNGGGGGDILFAILEETLDELTTTNAFSVNLDGGRNGDGGNGGARGEGGQGGQRGYTRVCGQAKNGAQGQPGRIGSDGLQGRSAGDNGHMQIMTVTQEAWDEQLTRPWLYDVTPDGGFPETSVIIKGSRFADTDKIYFDDDSLPTVLRADGALSATIPANAAGGEHTIFSRRHDGQESNRIPFNVRPQLTGTLPVVTPAISMTLTGRAFVDGATVEYDGGHFAATVTSATSLQFTPPDVAGTSTTSDNVSLTVVNPDGERSNTLTAEVAGVLSNGFQIGVHDFSFKNDKDGRPNWGTFEDTYGSVEVWHELLDPIFGHPLLTAGFYAFYKHFLDGEDNGGLATGYCTALASIALNRFWSGNNDTFSTVVRDDAFRADMTAIHGRLLSRESLLSFHDQGRRGNANVISTFRAIESTFQSGGTRETAPMLFFVPSGAAWDAGYFDMISDSHCIVPTRIVYPTDYDGTSIDGVKMFCWDNNHPGKHNCFVEFREESGETLFKYVAVGSDKFDSNDGITLAVATLGEYLLRDVDLPFAGPLGLTSFVVDFLLSPATMSISDDVGRMTGHVGGQILSEIPDSHPAYLMPGMFMLPQNTGLTRRITGTGNGPYSYYSINPDGLFVGMNAVETKVGQVDRLLASGDGNRVRFIPAANKQVNMQLGRRVGDRVRGLSIEKFNAEPTNDLDITATPDLSMVRVSNQGPDVNLDVKLLNFNLPTEDRTALERTAVSVPSGSDLVVAVTNWDDLIARNVTTTSVAH